MDQTLLLKGREMRARFATFAGVVILGSIIIALAYFGRGSADGNGGEQEAESQVPTISSVSGPDAAIDSTRAELQGEGSGTHSPPELFRSIYDSEFVDSSRLLAAAEQFVVSNFPDDSAYFRWGVLQIDTSVLATANDIANGELLPTRFQIRPFEHVLMTATLTDYRPQSANNIAVWEGTIDDDPGSSVRLTAVSRPDRVSFIARVNSQLGHFVIVESDIPLTYVVVEVNPNYSPGRGS